MKIDVTLCFICRKFFKDLAESTKIAIEIPKLLKYTKKHGYQTLENNLISFTHNDSKPSQKDVLIH